MAELHLLDDLDAIGFTEYEAKVFLALLKDHPATGYQLSKAAGIPRSMVYEALGRLDARGVVLKTEEAKATLYRPMPPSAMLDRLTLEHERRMQSLRAGLESLYTRRDEGYLWTFAGESPVLSYAANMLDNAEQEAMLVLADNHLDALRAQVTNAYQRGVAVGVLLTGSGTLDVGQVAYHPPTESKLHKLSDSLVVVIDEQEVLISSAEPDCTATVTTNGNMVQIGRQFVWMELFAHRIFSQIGPDLLARLDPADRDVFEAVGRTH
ncbi:TrmB family transcriptional regulator [Aggregatilinea lenta]|uniref:TrmB family transcriptional regulator n=1 Tax=Aggregatilinea lenta TaxID=913108 RepID=UPI000E5AA3FF|nr:helix-turn-helix domain-containing protein [Aggregatilinea lenta]